MIKINLLPRIINEKAAVRNLALTLAVVLVAVIVGGLVYVSKLRADVADMEQKASFAEQWEAKVKAIQQETETVKSSTKPLQQKLDFIRDVLKYNEAFPDLYEQIAKWTYSKVMLMGLKCDGTEVDIVASVKTLDDLGRYLLNMYRAGDLFTSVSMTSTLPGYPKTDSGGGNNGGNFSLDLGGGSGPAANMAGMEAINSSISAKGPRQGWIAFTVKCMLKTPIKAPTFGGSTGGAGATGAVGGGTSNMTPSMPTGKSS